MDKEMRKAVWIAIAAVIVLAVAFSGWYYLAGRNDVHDIGERADEVRNQLEDAGSAQRAEGAAIDSAQQSVGEGQRIIEDSQRTVDRIQETERSDAELIRESQSIIDGVRERGPAQGAGEG